MPKIDAYAVAVQERLVANNSLLHRYRGFYLTSHFTPTLLRLAARARGAGVFDRLPRSATYIRASALGKRSKFVKNV